MAINTLYEGDYVITGWFDDGGFRDVSWFASDLSTDAPITLNIFVAGFVEDPAGDAIFPLLKQFQGTPIPIPGLPPGLFISAGVWVQVYHPAMFDDPDDLFTPISIRALGAPDQMLRNEVRRIR